MCETINGRIFRLHRIETNITMSELSKQTGIAKSKLSEFENGKRNLQKNIVIQLYLLIGIVYLENKDTMNKVENHVKSMYRNITRCLPFEANMNNLQTIKDDIQCTNVYITWKLGEFLYYVYNKDEFYNYKKASRILLAHKSFLQDCELQILYDTLGVYYKDKNLWESALEYFENGLKINASTMISAMINYHSTPILISEGNLYMALTAIKKAKEEFGKELCFHRSIMCSAELGRIYICLGNYERAELLYLQCLEVDEEVNYPEKKKIILYNNLLWNYLLGENYEKLLSYGKDALELERYDADINSYLAYAYWRMDERDKAKEMLKVAKRNISNSSKKDQKFIEALNSMLLNKPLQIIEKKLLSMYEEASKDFDLQVQQLALKLLMEMCEKHNNSEKELRYAKKLIEVMKEQH